MKKFIQIIFFVLLVGSISSIAQEDSTFAQEDLEAMLEKEMGESTDYTFGTFLSSFVLNNQSVEMLNKNGLNLRFAHKFGPLNGGVSESFGFDYSSVYMGIEYAPTNWLNFGLGRGTFNESVNGMLKLRFFRQSKGATKMPVSIALNNTVDCKTFKYQNEELNSDFAGRLDYTSQLLIARQFMSLFSLQLMPSYTHRNLVNTKADLNDIYSLGFGGTVKLLKRFRFNAEYFIVQNHDIPDGQDYFNPVSMGVSYETSRHSFELFATNAEGITDNNYIAYNTYNFWKGDIRIGFNISIIFTLKHSN